MPMSSLFQSTYNTRYVPGSNYRFIRSDVPDKLTDEEIKWLLGKGVHTVIDLRTTEEQLKKPCRLACLPEFRYLSLPVSGGNVVPSRPGDVSLSYLEMCDEHMNHILKTILDSKSGVIFFCNAGKDRTGVVTALLMKHLGCTEKEIIDDYLLSKYNLEPLLKDYAAKQDVSAEVITPCERYIREFLERYHNKYQRVL